MVGGVVNWCLANGLTIEQADRAWALVAKLPPPSTPSDFVRQMEQAAKEVRRPLESDGRVEAKLRHQWLAHLHGEVR